MEKNFDAIKMVRDIRDKIYEEVKDMSCEDRIKYFNEKGKQADKELRKNTDVKV